MGGVVPVTYSPLLCYKRASTRVKPFNPFYRKKHWMSFATKPHWMPQPGTELVNRNRKPSFAFKMSMIVCVLQFPNYPGFYPGLHRPTSMGSFVPVTYSPLLNKPWKIASLGGLCQGGYLGRPSANSLRPYYATKEHRQGWNHSTLSIGKNIECRSPQSHIECHNRALSLSTEIGSRHLRSKCRW